VQLETTELWVAVCPPDRRREAGALAARAWDEPPGRPLEETWDEQVRVVVAVDAGELVGVTTARVLRPGVVAMSDETVVKDGWRGQGIAALLLGRMTALLRAEGIHRIVGQSSLRRPHSLQAMLRLGFRVEAVLPARGMPGFTDGTLVAVTRLDL
jgi:GNAT superfamily N-acetyltransferase